MLVVVEFNLTWKNLKNALYNDELLSNNLCHRVAAQTAL
jgi:hypothetical protein